MTKFLLEKGANLDLLKNNEMRFLFAVCGGMKSLISQLLEEQTVDVNRTTKVKKEKRNF